MGFGRDVEMVDRVREMAKIERKTAEKDRQMVHSDYSDIDNKE